MEQRVVDIQGRMAAGMLASKLADTRLELATGTLGRLVASIKAVGLFQVLQ